MSRRFWVPMNQLPMYKQCIYVSRNDTSDYMYKTCLSIPSSTSITDEQMETVIAEIKKAIG
jgi:perosamine synthetase